MVHRWSIKRHIIVRVNERASVTWTSILESRLSRGTSSLSLGLARRLQLQKTTIEIALLTGPNVDLYLVVRKIRLTVQIRLTIQTSSVVEDAIHSRVIDRPVRSFLFIKSLEI